MKRSLKWLIDDWQWPQAALFCGIVCLVLLGAIFPILNLASLIVALQLPNYMIHQFEEHHNDRFRNFVNLQMGNGREVLTRNATFFINSVGVWGVNLCSLALMAHLHEGFGLFAIYLTLVNGVIHCIPAMIQRTYNPGLWTAIVVFLPVGALGCYHLWNNPTLFHLAGLGTSILIHAMIIVYLKAQLRKAPASAP